MADHQGGSVRVNILTAGTLPARSQELSELK